MLARVIIATCVLLAIATVAQSRRWFAPEVSCWISQEKVPASWEDARRACEFDGAVLASPLNMQLFEYMQTLIAVNNHSAAYFIGTRANRSDSTQKVHHVSIEGKRLDEMPIAVFDAIDQLDLEQGDCLSMDRDGIRAVSCWDHLPYICYSNETTECGSIATQMPNTSPRAPVSTTSVSTTTTSSTSLCTKSRPSLTTIPSGYTLEPETGSFYKFHKSGLSWYEANSTCASEGADLVVVNDGVEADTVGGILRLIPVRRNRRPGGVYYRTWTGLRDSLQGGVSDWRTIRGEPLSEVFHEWWQGRSTNDTQKTCSMFSPTDKVLYDRSCEKTGAFLCEISQ